MGKLEMGATALKGIGETISKGIKTLTGNTSEITRAAETAAGLQKAAAKAESTMLNLGDAMNRATGKELKQLTTAYNSASESAKALREQASAAEASLASLKSTTVPAKVSSAVGKLTTGTASALKTAATNKTVLGLGAATGALVTLNAAGVLDTVFGGGSNSPINAAENGQDGADGADGTNGETVYFETGNPDVDEALNYLQEEINEIVEYLVGMMESGEEAAGGFLDQVAAAEIPGISDLAKLIKESGLGMPILVVGGAAAIYILYKGISESNTATRRRRRTNVKNRVRQ